MDGAPDSEYAVQHHDDTNVRGPHRRSVLLYNVDPDRIRTIHTGLSAPVSYVWHIEWGRALSEYSMSEKMAVLTGVATSRERDHSDQLVARLDSPRTSQNSPISRRRA